MTRFDCRSAQRCLERQLTGELSAADRRALEAHLAFCGACARDRALWDRAAALARDGALDAAVEDPASIPRIGPARRAPRGGWRRGVPWVAAAALLLGIAGALALPALRHAGREGGAVVSEEIERHPGSHVVAGEAVAPPSPPAPAAATAARDDRVRAAEAAAGSEPIHAGIGVGPAGEDGLATASPSPDAPLDLETAPSLEELLRLAEAQRAARQYGPACDTYAELVERYPGNEAAGTARVAIGQIELGALRQPGRALDQFQTYLEQEPLGVLAEEARVGRVRALAALGDDEQLLLATEDYLAFHPDGGATPEVLRTRGDTFRQRGDCERAVVSYRAVVERWGDSPHAAWAEEGLEACGGP